MAEKPSNPENLDHDPAPTDSSAGVRPSEPGQLRARDDGPEAEPHRPSPRAGSGNYAANWISEPSRLHAGPDHRRGGGFGGPQDSESRGETEDDAPPVSIGEMPGEVPGAREASAQGRSAGGDAPSYRGLGPQGYQRSDERLHELVCEILRDDARVDASHFTVEVKDGEVSLDGEVAAPEMKSRAEQLVAQCGVVAIRNRLRIVHRHGRDGRV